MGTEPTTSTAGRGLGIRHLQVAVLSVAAFMAYSLRFNLSVAIVAMVNKPTDANGTVIGTPIFDWDERIQGFVLSAFFWGYLLIQIPAGILTERFGGHLFLCGGILLASLLSLVFPICAEMGGWQLASANRVLQGITQGFIFPSVFTLLGVWAPPAERSRLASVAVSAQLLGTVVSTPVTGFLCEKYGWGSGFYVLGGVGVVVAIIMVFLGADSPSNHRMISCTEKDYITSSLGGAKKKQRVPWRHVFSSVPYYAAVIVGGFHGAVMVTFLTKVPTYLGTVLKFKLSDNGLITALPYLLSWLLTFLWSWICDTVIERGWLRVTVARKIFNSLAHFGEALFMVLLAHAGERVLSVVFLTLAITMSSGIFVGVQSTFVDLAPNFSGAIFAVANCVCNLIGVAGPNVVGFIVSESGNADQWRYVFYLCASLLVMSNLVFIIWGTSETQWWNWPERYKCKKDFEEHKQENEDAVKEYDATRKGSRRYSLFGADLME